MGASDPSPSRWLDRFVGSCFAAFLGAMALYGAVHLIASVWMQLSLGALAFLALAGAWLALQRYRGW